MEHAGDGWQTEGRPANLKKGSGPTTGSCASTVLTGPVVLKLYTNVACFDVINIKLTSIYTFDVLYNNMYHPRVIATSSSSRAFEALVINHDK